MVQIGEYLERAKRKGEVPGTVLTAIRQFMAYGKETAGTAHNGYYSEGSWPYEMLKKKFIEIYEEGEK